MTPAPPVVDDALLDALRTDLDAAPFTVSGVESVLGPLATAALHREQDVAALRVTTAALAGPAPDPAAVLTHVFLLGRAVRRGVLDAALPVLGVDGAVRLGLVSAAGPGSDDEVRAAVDLRPYAASDAHGDLAWWLASDLSELQTASPLAGDHVLGAGGASLTLAQVTMRTPRERVLDLGTGCGIQALHASRHARHVVATDISARALAFARFNLALAGVTNVELRQGSMLEPVAGEQFDLVVSNPPFVITPHASAGVSGLPDYEYRDGLRAGDDLVRDLVRGVGAVLAPGGMAQLLGNWEHRRGQAWTERVGAWLDEGVAGPLDGWVIQREVLDPAEYAETWIRDGGTTPEREPGVWAEAYGAWLDDFASRDVEAVGFGIVTLRRPDPAGTSGGHQTLRRLEEHTGSVRQPLGAHLAASLDAHDWLLSVGAGGGAGGAGGGGAAVGAEGGEVPDLSALADQRLVVAADVTEERYLTPGAADPNVVLLRQGDGLGRAVHASTGLAALVGACDGELTVGQLVGAIATLFDVPEADLAAELLPAVAGLVRDGFLHPSR